VSPRAAAARAEVDPEEVATDLAYQVMEAVLVVAAVARPVREAVEVRSR